MAERPAAYRPQIDGLRCAAISLVVAEHTFPTFRGLEFGFLGVRLFFVISGFLITGILLDAREKGVSKLRSLGNFYARRALRIFPIYFLVLGFLYALDVGDTRATIGWHALFLTNECLTRYGFVSAPLNHYWSLAVEEQFYLIWPWLIFWLPPRSLGAACAVLVMIAPASRFIDHLDGRPYMTLAYPLTGCTDSLGMGAFLAFCKRRGEGPFSSCIAACGVLGIPAFIGLYAWGMCRREGIYIGGLDFAWALTGTWLVGRASVGFRGIMKSVLEWPPVIYIGRISYGIYVYHFLVIGTQPVVVFDLERTPENLLWSRCVAVATMVGVASLSWYAFERPINGLKEKFRSRPENHPPGRKNEL